MRTDPKPPSKCQDVSWSSPRVLFYSLGPTLSVFVINYLKLSIDHFIIYANATGWSEITEIIVRGEAKDNYLICNRTSTGGIRV